MARSMAALLLVLCGALVAGAHAQRQLLCNSDVGLGGHRAYALPGANLILGHVRIQNRGHRPLAFQRAGYRLSGMGGPIDGDLRCPGNSIPAGGYLQCGFVARCNNPMQFRSFQPVVIPMGGSACSPQPLSVQPYFGSGLSSASANANAFSSGNYARSFADACAQAFGGGSAYSTAMAKANSWSGDAYGLANAVCDSIFGGAAANSQAIAQSSGGPAQAQSSADAKTVAGPASASNQAVAVGQGAAVAQGAATAVTGSGPADAKSSSTALQTGAGGIAAATDKATAVSGNGPARAQSEAAAVNAGSGPALAQSQSNAAGAGFSSADSKATAVSANGPAVATSSASAFSSGK